MRDFWFRTALLLPTAAFCGGSAINLARDPSLAGWLNPWLFGLNVACLLWNALTLARGDR